MLHNRLPAQDKEMPRHGALAGAPVTLAPSARGIGPNTYLAISHFWAMLCAAMIVHMLVLTIYSLLPEQKVTSIPVRALSFKLGPQENMAAYGLQMAVERSQPAAAPAPAPVVTPPVPVETPKPEPVTAAPAPVIAAPPPVQFAPQPEQRQRPAENMQATVQPAPQPAPQVIPVIAPAPVIAPPQPAIAPSPQRYVREPGLPALTPITGGADRGYVGQGVREGTMGGQGTQTVLSAQAADDIRTRYEQQISVWIERHKIYPMEAGRATGRVVLRVRVDRQGYVRYYAVERGSGNPHLDRAAIEMVRRANPVPAAPTNYPAGNLIEFLIPILFEAP